MPPSRPTWRRAFDTIERGVGLPLETLVRSERFFDAVALSTRARTDVQRRVERVTRRALHFVNVPAATDVRRLSDQVTRLDRRVLALTKELDENQNGRPRVRATKKS
jgi:hypothetical protein